MDIRLRREWHAQTPFGNKYGQFFANLIMQFCRRKWGELVQILVWLVEYGIVEIEIEIAQRIVDIAFQTAFVDIEHPSVKFPFHFNCRVNCLGR